MNSDHLIQLNAIYRAAAENEERERYDREHPGTQQEVAITWIIDGPRPPLGRSVLTCDSDDHVEPGYYDSEGWRDLRGDPIRHVKAWAYFPNAPQQ